eukprot:TRINITY_DN6596_c0_g1_i2.p1 TRINITY_DN6596_c0_g1~~TRINITY_DN6596_c0_g1_i2.p1  ORF type:complete len:832 (-),score=173.17 TRINITY_DN6596_c0_g1_i2:223-2718(-)
MKQQLQEILAQQANANNDQSNASESNNEEEGGNQQDENNRQQGEEQEWDDDFDLQGEEITGKATLAQKGLMKSKYDYMKSTEIEKQKNQKKLIIKKFENVKKTQEFKETQYLANSNDKQQLEITHINLFWVDLCEYILKNQTIKGFVSGNFIFGGISVHEIIATLSFSDIGFESNNFKLSNLENDLIEISNVAKDGGRQIVVYSEQLMKAKVNLSQQVNLQSQIFLVRNLKNPAKEFIAKQAYLSQITIINLGEDINNGNFFFYYPAGSIPLILGNNYQIASSEIILRSKSIQTLSYSYYFPSVGSFSQRGCQLSNEDSIIFQDKEKPEINVVKEQTIYEANNYHDIIKRENPEELVNYMAKVNLLDNQVFSFYEINKLLNQEKFYWPIINLLRKQCHYQDLVWRYGFIHNDFNAVLEWIQQRFYQKSMDQYNLSYIKTEHVKVDTLNILEYFPLLSNRIHNFMSKDKHKILNNQLRETYRKFLQYLIYSGNVMPEHYLVWCYYLLVQDRVEETLKIFKKIDPSQVKECQVQYDYMNCYLDIQNGYPHFKLAREVVERYLNYPVISWRNLFLQLKNQLTEYDGDAVNWGNEISQVELSKNETQLQKEEFLNAKVEKKNEQQQFLEISYTNLKLITIKYYLFDMELLFSMHPFLAQNFEKFGLIYPNYEQSIELQKSQENQIIQVDIPKQLAGKNMFIQVIGMSKKIEITHFSNALQIQTFEAKGVIKVTNINKQPLSRVYVKCYAKMQDNQEYFYRDGYTDLNGKYDYLASSAGNVTEIQKIALLVISENLGQTMLRIDPPKKIDSGEVEKKNEQNNKNEESYGFQYGELF